MSITILISNPVYAKDIHGSVGDPIGNIIIHTRQAETAWAAAQDVMKNYPKGRSAHSHVLAR